MQNLQLNPNATAERILERLDGFYVEIQDRVRVFTEAQRETIENDPTNEERINVYEGYIRACKQVLVDIEHL